MDVTEFINIIQSALNQLEKKDPATLSKKMHQHFLLELNMLYEADPVDIYLKMTQITIYFEGLYQYLADNNLQPPLTEVRAKRWKNHYGTPTVTFLLSYKQSIDKTKQYFDLIQNSTQNPPEKPWLITLNIDSLLDSQNNILVDPNCIAQIVIPPQREITGIFTKTHNPFGGFTTTPCDPVSQQFIHHAATVAKTGGKVLEIGSAFGAATLAAIAKGATVFCNDIDASNLAVVQKRYSETAQTPRDPATGDDSTLILIPGALPHELTGLPENFFDAILICRVLHFFTGAKIEESLALMSKLLTPQGKLYVICETPFLKNWQKFIPEFNSRTARGVEWPGEIMNPADYESSGRASSLPKFVHWITREVLERSLIRAGLAIEHSAYINRAGQFPEDLLLPEYGQESVGGIGIKQGI